MGDIYAVAVRGVTAGTRTPEAGRSSPGWTMGGDPVGGSVRCPAHPANDPAHDLPPTCSRPTQECA